ncbi:MAG: 50S ribosomal protein L6 [Eubacteriales bacterium]
MSRIGRLPITIPDGVTFGIEPDGTVAVKGKLGEMKSKFNKQITMINENGTITVQRPSDQKEVRALHGMTRALVANMVTGVSTGFTRQLDIVGVGYRAALAGSKLTLNLGYSHPVEIEAPEGISFELPNPTTIIVKGIDKQQVGQVAANIRSKRPPEPYKGKGVRFHDEIVRRKVGKTGMK